MSDGYYWDLEDEDAFKQALGMRFQLHKLKEFTEAQVKQLKMLDESLYHYLQEIVYEERGRFSGVKL